MNSKQRVLTTCNLNVPDQVPIDFWATRGVTEKLIEYHSVDNEEQLLDKLDIDIRYIPGPKYIGPPLKKYPDGSKEDIWGIRRKTQKAGTGMTYENVSMSPLSEVSSVDDVYNYTHWPSPDWFDYSVVIDQCKKYPERAIAFSGGRLNRTSQLKAAIYLRGMQKAMEDMCLAPKLLEAIISKIVEFYLEFNRRLFEAAGHDIDIFMMGDDFGMQDNLFCSIETWKKFFKPGLEQFTNLAKKYDIKTMHHSCGAIEPLIPELIDVGIDILNPIQPEAKGMDPLMLKKKYGSELTFHGSISIQKTLPYGSPEDVQKEVISRFNDLGPEGLILCTAHNIQTDTRMENINALFNAYQKLKLN